MSDDEKKPFHNPFAALKDKLGELPKGIALVAKKPSGPARAVVRLERKGRRGKEVTLIDQLDLSLKQRERWLKELKQSLGCGGALEGDVLVLQGDHRERVKALLEEKGVKKVTLAQALR